MLNRDATIKEINNLTILITELDLAIISEDDPDIKNGLKSAKGQVKSARTWLTKVCKDKGWEI